MNMDRYERQVILPEIGIDGQRKLLSSRVLIVGLGGLGAPVALYLAGAGIGTLGLADDDTVSLGNIHRQILYDESQVGRSKAECAAKRLSAMNSSVKLRLYPYRIENGNAEGILKDYDVVVDCSDNFKTRYMLDDACRKTGLPYVYGAIGALEGQISVFNSGERKRHYRDLYPDEDVLSDEKPSKGVLGVTPGVVGCMLAAEVIKLLTGFGTVMSGKLWTIDLRTGKTEIFDL